MSGALLQDPNLVLSADSTKTVNYKRDPHNYITQLFAEQFPPIQNGFFQIYLSKDTIVNPHWHTNVTEMILLIAGEAVASVFNPFTQKLLTYRLKPGQAALFPKGWFHWIVAVSDNVHLLAIFDEPTPDTVYGSDFLRFTPKEILHLAYCVDKEEYAKAVAPITESAVLGPSGCGKRGANGTTSDASSPAWPMTLWHAPQAAWPWPDQPLTWRHGYAGTFPAHLTQRQPLYTVNGYNTYAWPAAWA